jgi:hypothetical protein
VKLRIVSQPDRASVEEGARCRCFTQPPRIVARRKLMMFGWNKTEITQDVYAALVRAAAYALATEEESTMGDDQLSPQANAKLQHRLRHAYWLQLKQHHRELNGVRPEREAAALHRHLLILVESAAALRQLQALYGQHMAEGKRGLAMLDISQQDMWQRRYDEALDKLVDTWDSMKTQQTQLVGLIGDVIEMLTHRSLERALSF